MKFYKDVDRKPCLFCHSKMSWPWIEGHYLCLRCVRIMVNQLAEVEGIHWQRMGII